MLAVLIINYTLCVYFFIQNFNKPVALKLQQLIFADSFSYIL